ncbi:branched-chain amino acid ABC transporter permease [Ureibacillus sp. FSL E2-3493]|uniref:branched-chain amino acid ABC transporter permease n=1 Tax=Ureibacillus sp. FSL E2-3493 TaxID=2921367 RepID=UPI00311A044C
MLADFINPYHLQIASFILINILLAISVYVPLSSGQLSLGSAGFMGVGAYTSALLTIHFDLPIFVGILIGASVAGCLGIIIGIPSLRLSGVYLAIATLGLGEVIRVIFVNWESLTKGSIGLTGIPQMGRELLNLARDFGIQPAMFGLRNNKFVYLMVFVILFILVTATIWFVFRQQNSRVGRSFSSIQMDEKAAESMGINITYFKVLSFSQGAFLAGLAGALFAHVMGYISPSDFSYHRAVEILIFTVFGGSEVIIGSIFGAIFLTLIPEVLRFVSEYRYIIYGIMLVILMAVRPQGILDIQLLSKFKRLKRSKGGVR